MDILFALEADVFKSALTMHRGACASGSLIRIGLDVGSVVRAHRFVALVNHHCVRLDALRVDSVNYLLAI